MGPEKQTNVFIQRPDQKQNAGASPGPQSAIQNPLRLGGCASAEAVRGPRLPFPLGPMTRESLPGCPSETMPPHGHHAVATGQNIHGTNTG
jgi:hypothetical protein